MAYLLNHTGKGIVMKKQVAMSLVFSFLTLSLSASEDALEALATVFSSDDAITTERKDMPSATSPAKNRKIEPHLKDCICCVVAKYSKEIPNPPYRSKSIIYYSLCCGLAKWSFDELSCSLLCGLAKFCSDQQELPGGKESLSVCDIGCGCCVVGGCSKANSCCYGVAACCEGESDFTDGCDTVCNCLWGVCVWGDKKPSSCCGISCSEGENAERKTDKTTGLVNTL